MTKLVAFDLDGTLTQHKSPMSPEIRSTLDALRAHGYALLMVGAGSCARIARQMEEYPIDVLGNYGMQYAEWDPAAGAHRLVADERRPCDREGVLRRANAFRAAHGLTEFAGDSVEFHDSGVVTFALLGTKAAPADKLAFDPDRRRRRALYAEVRALFPDFTVFVGGSSSFDMAPAPFDKAYALSRRLRTRRKRRIRPARRVPVPEDRRLPRHARPAAGPPPSGRLVTEISPWTGTRSSRTSSARRPSSTARGRTVRC